MADRRGTDALGADAGLPHVLRLARPGLPASHGRPAAGDLRPHGSAARARAAARRGRQTRPARRADGARRSDAVPDERARPGPSAGRPPSGRRGRALRRRGAPARPVPAGRRGRVAADRGEGGVRRGRRGDRPRLARARAASQRAAARRVRPRADGPAGRSRDGHRAGARLLLGQVRLLRLRRAVRRVPALPGTFRAELHGRAGAPGEDARGAPFRADHRVDPARVRPPLLPGGSRPRAGHHVELVRHGGPAFQRRAASADGPGRLRVPDHRHGDDEHPGAETGAQVRGPRGEPAIHPRGPPGRHEAADQPDPRSALHHAGGGHGVPAGRGRTRRLRRVVHGLPVRGDPFLRGGPPPRAIRPGRRGRRQRARQPGAVRAQPPRQHRPGDDP